MDKVNDPYSAYLNEQAYQDLLNDFQGQYEGIGAEMGLKDGAFVVISVYTGAPADKAGLKAGDEIVAVDGTTVAGKSLAEITVLVRGPKGTTVTFTMQRPGESTTRTIAITRDVIDVKSVEFKALASSIAYIKISRFADNTNEELKPFIQQLQSGYKGIILDLRNNPGGGVDTVAAVASYFIKEGIVLSTVDSNGKKEVVNIDKTSIKTDLPMVVLVNAYSASGSEALSGALQDYKRAVIAGEPTFGKGSFDRLYPLTGGGGIYLTIGRWYTPNGRLIEGQGITPDYPLTLTDDDLLNWTIDYLN